MKITEEEYNQIIKELAKRLRDSIYINAEKKIREKTPKSFFEDFDFKDDTLEMNYDYQIMIGDLFQILGGIRRNKKRIKGRGKNKKINLVIKEETKRNYEN